MIRLVIEFFLIGFIGGLLGIFYRNCLKPKGMIFNIIYYGWLKKWAELPEDAEEAGMKPRQIDRVLSFIARPLGYCIYCSATWITFILCAIYLSSWEVLPKWQDIVIGVIAASGIQHITICIACRFLIHRHPDLHTYV